MGLFGKIKFNINFYFSDAGKAERKLKRFNRNIGVGEMFSLDFYLARIILPRLRYFREYERHGIPSKIYYPYQQMDLSFEEKQELAEKEWNSILDKMIRAFSLHCEDPYDDWEIDSIKKAEVEEGMSLFAEYFGCIWD